MAIFNFLKKSKAPDTTECINVTAGNGIAVQPIDGEIIPLAEIADGVFSDGVLGNGCGLIPSGEKVYAPISGTITTVAESNHAVGIEGDGVEMLIHVGLETVSMNGKGFDVKVKEGDKVTAGQLLYTFSLAEINKAEGVSTTSAVLVTNSDDIPNFEVLRTGTGKAGEPLFKIR